VSNPERPRRACAWWGKLFLTILVLAGSGIEVVAAPKVSDFASQFDQANRFYEQGRYTNAIGAYKALIQSGHSNSAVYFNLGNAWYKSNQRGRAIAAYRLAERMTPRDPGVRFNLSFVRRQVYGRDPAPDLFWRNWLLRLTVNEWTLVAAGSAWVWFTLLALREWRPALRRALRGYTATAGGLVILMLAGLAVVAYMRLVAREAVVIVPQGIARYGPLAESQIHYQLPDGSEVTVLDQRQVATANEPENWVQIRDEAQRTGWIKSDQLMAVH
jgi:tetratricopeptide (TPR) repeat protein